MNETQSAYVLDTATGELTKEIELTDSPEPNRQKYPKIQFVSEVGHVKYTKDGTMNIPLVVPETQRAQADEARNMQSAAVRVTMEVLWYDND